MENQKKTINQIRMLSAEMIQKANSGHPGLPLGAAAMAYALFHNLMKFDPENPHWANRDRFILSPGHGSALMYSLLHLYGYEVDLEDLKNFRQLGSKTPGHPEYWCIPGIETTTGPLASGFSQSVGFAIGERRFRTLFGKEIVDHYTYVIASDGDFMEGLSSEAASFAGTQKLDKLVVLYDSNQISIEGDTSCTFTEDVGARFEAFGWYVDSIDGLDPQAVTDAVLKARKQNSGKPVFIVCNTTIGKDAFEKEGTAGSHGSPLGDSVLERMRKQYGYSEKFHIDTDVQVHIKSRLANLKDEYKKWEATYLKWIEGGSEESLLYKKSINKEVSSVEYPVWESGSREATRKSSGTILNAIAKDSPSLIGGSADLAPSTKTWLNGFNPLSVEYPTGKNIQFGIREHAMGAIVNGLALYGGVIPYGATFLVFSDYMRHQIRLSALMSLQSIWIFTHDSIYVGEDGPTHQPIEHIDALRIIPGLKVLRPADGNECVAAYKFALNHKGPSAIILSRQGLLQFENSIREPDLIKGYKILENKEPKIQLYATGSEVELCVAAAEILNSEGLKTEVISIPLMDLKDPGSLKPLVDEYDNCLKVGVEVGTARLFGEFGIYNRIGIDHYGESGPAKEVAEHLGFVPQIIASKVKEMS
jgi:transketolase